METNMVDELFMCSFTEEIEDLHDVSDFLDMDYLPASPAKNIDSPPNVKLVTTPTPQLRREDADNFPQTVRQVPPIIPESQQPPSLTINYGNREEFPGVYPSADYFFEDPLPINTQFVADPGPYFEFGVKGPSSVNNTVQTQGRRKRKQASAVYDPPAPKGTKILLTPSSTGICAHFSGMHIENTSSPPPSPPCKEELFELSRPSILCVTYDKAKKQLKIQITDGSFFYRESSKGKEITTEDLELYKDKAGDQATKAKIGAWINTRRCNKKKKEENVNKDAQILALQREVEYLRNYVAACKRVHGVPPYPNLVATGAQG